MDIRYATAIRSGKGMMVEDIGKRVIILDHIPPKEVTINSEYATTSIYSSLVYWRPVKKEDFALLRGRKHLFGCSDASMFKFEEFIEQIYELWL